MEILDKTMLNDVILREEHKMFFTKIYESMESDIIRNIDWI